MTLCCENVSPAIVKVSLIEIALNKIQLYAWAGLK